ncbi:hypothetical protein QBC39DRAFT_370844 [Podospora conica]|nr:hypothetical protein QBC39DRAFT_370844 [Schizothecium conicum]
MALTQRASHPELAAEFDLLDRAFSHVSYGAVIKRVVARCCFLFPGEIPVHIINTGEKSEVLTDRNGVVMSGLRIMRPNYHNPDALDAQYMCGWIKVMDDLHLFISSSVDPATNEAYKSMSATLIQAAALLLLDEDPTLLITAFHTTVRALRSLFPGHIPLSQIVPADDAASPTIRSPTRDNLGNHIHAAHQSYALHLQYHPWTVVASVSTKRASALRTLQSLLNDLGWYHLHQGDFSAARRLGGEARSTTDHAGARQWADRNPDLAGPFATAPLYLDLDTLVLQTYAWAWSSLDEISAADMEAWFTQEVPGDMAGDEGFMRGYRRACRFWEAAVGRMLEVVGEVDGEGNEVGEVERWRGAVERLEGLYGSGRRMAVFWQFDEPFDWDLPGLGGRRARRQDVG